jgi:hypothetical protein
MTLLALGREPVDDAQAGLLTAREQVVEAAGLYGTVEELEKVEWARIAPSALA